MIAQFALRLIFGMSLMWCLMPRRQVTAGFFRIQMLIVMSLSVIATLLFSGLWSTETSPPTIGLLTAGQATWLTGLVALVAFVGSVVWTLQRRRAGTATVWIVMLISVGLLLSCSFSESDSVLILFTELSTAGLLGGAMVSMLLGHWYLTAPGMTLLPLSRLNAILGIATLVRVTVAALGLSLAWQHLETSQQETLVALRWLAGLAGPLLVVAMVWRILRFGNTQSATGVLYVGVVLTLIGELTATLLTRELSVPI